MAGYKTRKTWSAPDIQFDAAGRRIRERFLPTLPVHDPDCPVCKRTGGEKGSKLARFDLVPWDAVWGLAEHFGIGARKYEDRNWERGYAYGLSFAAMHRHAASWWMGEDLDPESGDSHLLAVAWHALALWWMQRHGKGSDDRPARDGSAYPCVTPPQPCP